MQSVFLTTAPNKSSNAYAYETLIFFDIETTGLINENGNDPLLNPGRREETWFDRQKRLENLLDSDGYRKNFPKITEISFVYLPYSLFQEGVQKMDTMKVLTSEDPKPVPVFANVCSNQVNPGISEKEWDEYENDRRRLPNIIRLPKADLIKKNSFEQDWPIFHLVLEISPKPLCVLAHNGIRFDFRILFHQLRCANLLERYPIPDQVYFLDTFPALFDLEMQFCRELELTTKNIDWKFVISKHATETTTKETMTETTETEEGHTLVNTIGKIEEETSVSTSTSAAEMKLNPPSVGNDDIALTKQGIEEHNPLKKRPKRRLFMDINSAPSPIDFMRIEEWSPAKRRRVNAATEFFKKSAGGEWQFNAVQYRQSLTKSGQFKLSDLYKRFFNTTLDAHRASSDCEALLQICLSYGKDFTDYLLKNASPFPSCFGPPTSTK